MVSSLAVAGVSTLVVAASYAYVATRLLRRSDITPAGRPLYLFGLWWLATAVNQAAGGALYVAASFGWTDLSVQLTYVHLQRLLLAVSLAALMYYLLYLQTGRRYLAHLCVVYGLWWTAQVYAVVVGAPDAVELHRWRTDLAYTVARPAWVESLQVLIVVPPVLGALALLRVYPRVATPTQRFRIAVLAGGFTLWWVVAVVAGNPATFEVDALQALNRVVGVTVALAVLVAYEPFAWMQRRFRLEPLPQNP